MFAGKRSYEGEGGRAPSVVARRKKTPFLGDDRRDTIHPGARKTNSYYRLVFFMYVWYILTVTVGGYA